MSDRFQVRSVTGYTIGAEGRQASRHERATYWICDLEGYPKQVAVFAPAAYGRVPGVDTSEKGCKRRAEARCAELNEWNRRELERLA